MDATVSLLSESREYFDWKNVAESLIAWTLRQTEDYRITEDNGHFYGRKQLEPHSLLWAFLDRGHTAPELRAELQAVWPRIGPGGVLAGHDYNQPNWSEVAPTIDAWAAEQGLELHVVPPYSFWVQKPGGNTPPFRVWNHEVLIRTPEGHAFNSSICEHPKDPARRIFAFRSVKGGWENGRIWIGLVDSMDLQFVSRPRRLDLEPPEMNCEDPRVFLLDSKVWLSYVASDWSSGKTLSRQHLVLLRETASGGWEPAMEPVRFPSPYHRPQDKNWIFFKNETSGLMALYGYSPEWVILNLSIRSPNSISERVVAPELGWPFGEIRGGTPLVRAPNGHLWTFFHSSSDHDASLLPEPVSYYNGVLPQSICQHLRPSASALASLPIHGRYFCGLLEVDSNTLLPNRITRQPLLYHFAPKPGRCGPHVMWPAGAIREGDELTVSYGLDDRACYCCRFSAKLLDELLFPV